MQVNQSVLVEASKVAQKFPAENRAIVEKMCTEINELIKELEALQGKEEVSQP